jgi:hypothetical protein
VKKLIALAALLPALATAQIVPGVVRDVVYPAPPLTGAWSYAAVGSGVCTSVTDSSGTLTVEASGATIESGCFVYQIVTEAEVGGGAQVYGRLATSTGTASATARVGPLIASGLGVTNARCGLQWNDDGVDQDRGYYRANDGAAANSGIQGNATAIPVTMGITFNETTDECQFYDFATATVPAAPATDFADVPTTETQFPSAMSSNFYVGFFVSSGHVSDTVTVTINDYDVNDVLTLAGATNPDPDQYLIYRADFETGDFTYRTGTGVDDAAIQTMRTACEEDGAGTPVACPDPAVPPRCWTTQSCGSHTHAYSDTVVTSDGAVNPRGGNYMLRYETRVDDYPVGNPPGVTNERAASKTDKNTAAELMEYDTTYYIGISVYKPSAEYSPTYTDTALQVSITPELSSNNHMTFLTFRPQNAGDTTPTQMRASCRYYTTGPVLNSCPGSSTGMTYENPIDDYYDEWMDIIIEFKAHNSTGVYKVYTRRAEQTNDYTLQAEYTGPLGWFNSDKKYTFGWQLYGGGGFPLVIYYDEIRIVDSSLGGTIEDAKPTPFVGSASTANPNASPEAVALLQQITDFPNGTRQIGSGIQIGSFSAAPWASEFVSGGDVYELKQVTSDIMPWLWGTDLDSTCEACSHDYTSWASTLTTHVNTNGGSVLTNIHARCPGDQSFRWDDDECVNIAQLITPGTSEYNDWRSMLDEYAVGLQLLENNNVPIILRMFHEFNRTSYWWSYNNSTMTSAQFITLWQQTFDYLVNTKGLDNVLFMWGPTLGAGLSVNNTETYWPGDNYVDLIGLSNYRGSTWDAGDQTDLDAYIANATTHGKPIAFAEGYAHGTDEPNLFDNADVLTWLNSNPEIAYFMFWHEAKAPHNYPNPSTIYNDSSIYNRPVN